MKIVLYVLGMYKDKILKNSDKNKKLKLEELNNYLL